MSRPPCALRGPKVHGDTVQCSRCTARRWFWPGVAIVPSVFCDAFVQPVGKSVDKSDDLASWRSLGSRLTDSVARSRE